MNIRGIRVGTLVGIPIRLNWSLLAIFSLVSWGLAVSAYPELAPGYRSGEYWAAAVITGILFFTSLLAHELSHSVVAVRLGIKVRDITLWLFGGVSRIEGEAHTPRDEMKIAIAGPATSAAIAVAGVTGANLLAAAGAPPLLANCALWLGAINALLAVFNMVPAAPLDGGRILHAWLWHRRGDRTSAGISATRAGGVFGWLLATVGIVEFVTIDTVGGLWFIVLGWFLITAAKAEETQYKIERDLAGVRVRDVMTTNVMGVRDRVVTGDTTTTPDDLLLDVLMKGNSAGNGRMLVFSHGTLVGVVSPTEVARAIEAAELAHVS
jgi:Zn-dependent protease